MLESRGRTTSASELDDTLHGPEQSDGGDRGGGGNDKARLIPRLVVIPHRDGEERGCDHGELRELDADVEADQGRNDFRARQLKLGEHTGKSHSMQQPESEHYGG